MHIHQTAFNFGDIVYLNTDTEQLKRIIVGITLRFESKPFYELGCGSDSSFHFEVEMSKEVDENLKLGIEINK